MCNGLTLMAHENAEDIKFLGSQMDSLAADEDDSFFEINTQLREFYGRKWLLRMEPPQRRTNASPQFFDSEGLHDVVVGSRIESNDFVVFGAPHRHHNNGSVKGQSDFSTCVKPVHSGYVYIQKNQVRVFSDQQVDSLFAALCLDHLVAILRKSRSQHTTDLQFVVDDENGCIFSSLCRGVLHRNQLL